LLYGNHLEALKGDREGQHNIQDAGEGPQDGQIRGALTRAALSTRGAQKQIPINDAISVSQPEVSLRLRVAYVAWGG